MSLEVVPGHILGTSQGVSAVGIGLLLPDKLLNVPQCVDGTPREELASPRARRAEAEAESGGRGRAGHPDPTSHLHLAFNCY